MVKLVEIEENEYDSDSQYTTDSESVASSVDEKDADSDFESDYDDDLLDESLLERLAALKDIVPAQHRQTLSRSVSRLSYWGDFGMRLVGKLGWVLTTSALLVVFPLALETDRDKMMQQWESEQGGMQQQQGQMPPPGMAGPPGPGLAGPAPGLA